jgi:signal transduction histidine kinase
MTERSVRTVGRESAGGLVTGLADKLSELDRAVQRQTERFTAVLDISTQISAARDVDDLLLLVMERLTGLVGAEAATLFMADEATEELWSRVLRGSSLKEIRIPWSAGVAGHVFQGGKTLLLGDAYDDIRFNPEIDRQSGFRTRSMIAAPLRHVSGKVLGVIEVLHRKVNVFSVDDRRLVEGVAHQVAAVLDNVLLMDQLKKKNEALRQSTDALSQAVLDLDLLYELEKTISVAGATDDLLDRVLARAMTSVGAGAGSILLSEEDEGDLFFRSTRGDKSDALHSMKLEPGRGIAGHVAATGETVRVDDASESRHYDKTVARKLGVSIGAVLAVPITAEGQIIGALELLNKKGGFTPADERLATLLAGQAGRAIVLRRAREKGEQQQRLSAIGRMLSSVLHDVRTPMTVISGFAELMANENDPVERRAMAETILGQLEHLNAMTRETLAFARGERTVLVRKVYLQNFFKDVRAHLEQEFKPTQVELKLQVDYTGVARFDETKLKRVIYNIARNAIEAMPGGGKFTLTVDRVGDELVMKFADNGPGIPEDIAPRLFEEFVTSGKRNGTGLGLAMVKTVAEEHGGTVTCKSRPGKGTTFELKIPAGTPN